MDELDGARTPDEQSAVYPFPGDSVMAARMRGFDWSLFGSPWDWPSSLRVACRICLTSRFPMIVWWGPQLRMLYNDAYLPLLGSKHPALGDPGQQVWAEIWHIVGPMLAGVLRTGEATWSDDLLLPMNRHGYWEETYWTYSYSPLHDDDGAIRGVFTAVTDTTQRVIGERRLAALQDLGSQAGTARTEAEACQLIAASMARAEADIPFAAIYLRQPGTDELTLTVCSPAGDAPAPRSGGRGGWPLAHVLRDGRQAVLADVLERFGELPGGGWARPPTEAMVLPLHRESGAQPLGVMVLAASAGRALDRPYRSFLELVARQAAGLINGAVAYRAEQRRAEELAELDRAKTVFYSNVSHEFRTPLTLIMGPLEELRSAVGTGDPKLREELDMMYRNGMRLTKLVNTLLDFSRLQAGRIQASYEPVDLAGLTAELASVFRAAIERAGLGFEVSCPPLDEPVFVDRDMWEKVVLNLLSNAVKFTFHGAIQVSLHREPEWAVMRVADTGTGIAPDDLPRLFERFHRIEGARARSNEGSGIGLALVQELVALHGGTINAQSTVDVGTTFTVRLPFGHDHLPPDNLLTNGVAAGAATLARPFIEEALRWLPADDVGEVSAPERPERPAPSAVGRYWVSAAKGSASGDDPARVLIADDNADMRDYLRRLLSPDYDVRAVGDGAAMLRAVQDEQPDLIISDVMMPGVDGVALVGALRADPRTARVPVLLLSARAGQEAAVEGLLAGADDYLVKPFSAKDLLARVRTNLRLARLRSQHAEWRAAFIDALQEGFFVCDASGAVVEINEAFSALLGYGAEGLPYSPPFPWWPDADADPDRRAEVESGLARSPWDGGGTRTRLFRHRDGQLVWVALTYTAVPDPDGTAQHILVGTIRDVTAERQAAEREVALARLTARLSEAGTVHDVLSAGLDELSALWHARQGLATTWHRDGQTSLVSTAPGARWPDLDAALREAITAIRGGRPLQVTVGGRGSSRSGAGTTLEYADGLVAIWLDLDPGRPFGVQDRAQLALMCGHLSQALHRAHSADQQRDVALTLQRSFLGPVDLPAGFAVRYEPAVRPLEVGGDWYDVIELPDNRMGLVVGDCVGRGLPAAAVMGQLRSACRALLLQAAGPGQTLAALDRFAAVIPDASCATLFCAILDRTDGTLRYSSAGHPPGILVHIDGEFELLENASSVPLAAVAHAARTEATTRLRQGSLLLLYTDGLVERHRQLLGAGINRAADALVAGRTTPVNQLADYLMARLVPDEGFADDIAVLLYRHRCLHPPCFISSFPADPRQLAEVRRGLRTWLLALGLAPIVADRLLVATGEACNNAIEHAYGFDAIHHVLVSAHTDDGELRITVGDTGRWKPPSDAGDHRGHGLRLIEAFAPRFTIDTTPSGTTINLYARIARDPALPSMAC